MNVREASKRFHVPGCSYAVNRYYVISGELRDLGWTGAGEYWYDGYGGRRTFEEAARLLDLDRWYEYNVLKEEILTRWTKLKSTLHLAFEELAGAIVGVWDSSNLARYGGGGKGAEVGVNSIYSSTDPEEFQKVQEER